MKGWYGVTGEDILEGYGQPPHARHVYLPYFNGNSLLTRKFLFRHLQTPQQNIYTYIPTPIPNNQFIYLPKIDMNRKNYKNE